MKRQNGTGRIQDSKGEVGLVSGQTLGVAFFLASLLLIQSGAVFGQEPARMRRAAIQSSGETRVLTMPEGLASFGAALQNGRIHIYSGHRGRVHQHDNEAVWPGSMSIALDQETEWRDEVKGPAVQGSTLVTSDLGLIRIGGLEARNERGEKADLHSRADCQLLGKDLERWADLPALPRARSSHDAAILNGKLYVAGGWDLQGKDSSWAQDLLVLDLSRIEAGWSSIPTDVRVRAQATVAYRNRIWLMGGLTEEGRTSRNVVSYEPGTGRWIDGPLLPEQGFGAAAVVTEFGLIVSLPNGDILRLADDGESWEHAGTLALPRYFHRLLHLGEGRMIALGGQSEFGRLAHAEVFTMREGAPKASTLVLEIAHPGEARNRQAIGFEKGRIRLIGGNNGLEQHDFAPERFTNESLEVSLADLSVERIGESPVTRQSMTLRQEEGYQSRRSRTEKPAFDAVLLGGFGHDGEIARSFSDCYVHGTAEKRWEPIAALPRPLTQFGAFLMDQKIWLFGGLDYDPSRPRAERFDHRAETLVYDLETKEGWRESKPMPEPRRAFASARLADHVYVVGGMGPDFSAKEKALAFDMQAETWEEIASPATRIGADLVALQGKLYLGGGSLLLPETKTKSATTIECYDPATKTWSTSHDALPITGPHTRLLASDRRLILFSTHNDEKLIRVAILALP